MRASLIVPVIVVLGCGGQPPSPAPASTDTDMAAHTVTVVIPQNAGAPPCVPAAVLDPAIDCRVLEIERDASGAIIASDAVAKCSDPGGRSPCWEISAATPTCSRGEFELGRTAPPPPGTTDEAVCALP